MSSVSQAGACSTPQDQATTAWPQGWTATVSQRAQTTTVHLQARTLMAAFCVPPPSSDPLPVAAAPPTPLNVHHTECDPSLPPLQAQTTKMDRPQAQTTKMDRPQAQTTMTSRRQAQRTMARPQASTTAPPRTQWMACLRLQTWDRTTTGTWICHLTSMIEATPEEIDGTRACGNTSKCWYAQVRNRFHVENWTHG